MIDPESQKLWEDLRKSEVRKLGGSEVRTNPCCWFMKDQLAQGHDSFGFSLFGHFVGRVRLRYCPECGRPLRGSEK